MQRLANPQEEMRGEGRALERSETKEGRGGGASTGLLVEGSGGGPVGPPIEEGEGGELVGLAEEGVGLRDAVGRGAGLGGLGHGGSHAGTGREDEAQLS